MKSKDKSVVALPKPPDPTKPPEKK